MATRRRGGADLDDLKARLGYGSSSAEAPDPEAAAAAARPVASAAAEEPETPANDGEAAADTSADEPAMEEASAAADSQPAEPPSADDAAGEDYSTAVSDLESTPMEFDVNAVDAELQAPGGNKMVGLMIAAAASLVVGIAFGAVGSTANFARSLDNAVADDAASAVSLVQPRAERIRTLNAAIQDLDTARFSSDFEAHLRTAMADGELGASATALGQLNALMGYDEGASRDLVDFVVASNHVSRLVQRHLALTERDRAEIDRLMEGAADNREYGVAVALETMIANYQSFVEDPAANPFTPLPGERVSFDSLEMVVEGEGDEQREFYDVTNAAGESMRVAVHDLIALERAQLLPPSTGETALDRYAARAESIKEAVSALTATQAQLLSALEERAAQPRHTTF